MDETHEHETAKQTPDAMSSNQAGQQGGNTNSLEEYMKDLDRILEYNTTDLQSRGKSWDLQQELNKYKKKVEDGEFPDTESKTEYFLQNVTPIADEVRQLENKKEAVKQPTSAPHI